MKTNSENVYSWQPIETAPKDGTLFLCWVAAVRYGETDDGQQYQQDASQIDFCSWRNGPTELPECGYFDPCCGQIGDAQDVTHWMPIPNPPGTHEINHNNEDSDAKIKELERIQDVLVSALKSIESSVDWTLGRSAATQSRHGRGFEHGERVRKNLFDSHDKVREALASVKEKN